MSVLPIRVLAPQDRAQSCSVPQWLACARCRVPAHKIILSKCRSRRNCVAERMKCGKMTVGLHQHVLLDNPCTYGTCRKAMGLEQ